MTTNEFRDTAATTLARIEAKQDVMGDKIDILSVTLLGNGKPEDGLLFKVTEHHARPHLHGLMKNKMFWAIMFAVIVAANVMLDLGSPVVALVGRLLGVPIQ